MKIAGRRAAIKWLCYLNFQQSLNMQCFQTCSLLQPPTIFSNLCTILTTSFGSETHSSFHGERKWWFYPKTFFKNCLITEVFFVFLLFLQLIDAKPNHKASPPALHWRHFFFFFFTFLTGFFWDHLDALIPPILYGQLQTIVPIGLRCSEKHTQAVGICGQDQCLQRQWRRSFFHQTEPGRVFLTISERQQNKGFPLLPSTQPAHHCGVQSSRVGVRDESEAVLYE